MKASEKNSHHGTPRKRTHQPKLGVIGISVALLLATLLGISAAGGAGALSLEVDTAHASDGAPIYLPVGQPGSWDLAFDDEFDGVSLDTTKWTTGFPWCGSASCVSSTTPDMVYLPQNVLVSDGTLKLRGKHETGTGQDGRTYSYTSGMVTSSGKFQFKYGYMEMRAKVPSGRGLWPAFWTLPPNGKWPPEIDVMEVLGHDTRTVQLHYHYAGNDGEHRDDGGEWSTYYDLSAGFHTFAVSWQPNAIRWYVDGIERRTAFTRVDAIPAEQMYLILNLQVGGAWPGNPDGATPFPSDFEVDYVRVWSPAVAQSPLTFYSPAYNLYRTVRLSLDSPGAFRPGASPLAAPPVAIAGQDTVVSAGASVTFNGAGSHSANARTTSYLWTFSDGRTYSGSSVTRTFPDVGLYQATLAVTDSNGASNSDTIKIAVLPQASFSPVPAYDGPLALETLPAINAPGAASGPDPITGPGNTDGADLQQPSSKPKRVM